MHRASQPLYQKVKEHILDKIQTGALKPHQRIPSENELVATLRVSRMTVNRALRELTEAGTLFGVTGVGRFVADQTTRGELLEIRNIAEEIRRRGHTHQAETLLAEEEEVSESSARFLNLLPGDRVFHTQIVHSENGRPLQFEDRFVNPAVAPDYGSVDFSHRTPHDYLMAVAPIQEAEHSVRAGMPSPYVRSLLDMGPNEPCLELFRRTWAMERVATIAWLHHPSSRFVLGGRFKPGSANTSVDEKHSRVSSFEESKSTTINQTIEGEP